MKKLQVFVSSTYLDLQEERQKMVEGILNAGHIPAGMELFGGPATVIKTIQRWIDASDMYILLLGGKYGSIYKQENMGFTEWEYRYARSKHKPVCAVILSDSMLYQKAAKYGEENVFEKKYKKKYAEFRKYVEDNGLYKEISDVLEIPGVVQSHISETLRDPDYDLVGWIPGNSVVRDWKTVTTDVLKNTYNELFESYVAKIYQGIDIADFSKTVGENFLKIIKANGLINSLHRIVEFYKVSDGLIKVVIEDEFEYLYLAPGHCRFGKMFQATKQQAETYVVDKLLINDEDYTSEFQLDKVKNENRGQLKYYVKSNKSVEFENDFPVNIYYKSSYICPALDFFQAYGLPFPCKNFFVDLYLRDNLDQEYSIVVSTNSMFSRLYADSFKANEMKNFGVCRIKLQEWSLASDGYTATLKKRTEENH